jgi:gliding motility-associated-like protein
MPPEIIGEDGNPIDTIYISTIKNIPVDVCVEANDPEGNIAGISSVVSHTGNGSAEDLLDLCFTFVPALDFIGMDTLTVQVCDDGIPSKCDTVIVVADVQPEPDATPYIVDITGVTIDTLYFETDEDVALDFCLYVDELEDEELELGSITEAGDSTAHGTLNENDEGPYCFTYQPEENYFGESSWIIKVCNDSIPAGCDSVVVIIDVLPVNDAPVAVNDTVTAISSYPLTGNVTDNDYDIEGDALIVNENPEANPMHGAVVLQPNGDFEYIADPGYLGEDRFTYVVCDDGDPSLCASAEVIITVDEIPLKVYNAVSPNGDDLNDFLYIEGIEYYPDNVLSIYDRYNNLIFETPGYNNDNITWVGQANKGISKKDLPGDTYFYILNPGDGTPLLKGFIMLKIE